MIKDNRDIFAEIIRILPLEIRNIFIQLKLDFIKLIEIRIRVGRPVILIYDNEEYYLDKIIGLAKESNNVYIVKDKEINELLQYVSNYSLYAYEEEIRQGFITVMGGHRIGLAGRVIMEGNRIKNIRNISCINIRISHQIIGCASRVIPYIYDFENKNMYHTLIVSPPMSGKTTLLRDIIRMISNGYDINKSITVGVVDERSEIAACYNGIPQNDLGIRTDVMDCCPKSEGMMMLIRSMSPHVIAVDEIGASRDMETIEYVINCGCKILATVHGSCVEDIKNKPILGNLVRGEVFERFIILNNKRHVGNIKEIFDKRGSLLYSES